MIKILAWLFSVVPTRAANSWGRGLGRFLHLILPGKKHLAASAIKESFPDWPQDRIQKTVKNVFLTQGIFISEVLRFVGGAKDNPLDSIDCSPELFEQFKQLHGGGKGVLVLTAHINNYELLLTWAALHFPMTTVTKKIRPPSLDDFILKLRTRNKINVLPARGSYRGIIKALKKGDCIGFVFDQNMKHFEGIFVTFFGRPACTTPGLAMLSAHAQSPVLPVCLIRKGDRYQLTAYPVIPPPPDRESETLHAYTQKYSNAVENMVREQPEAWIWMHKRWKTQTQPGDRITLPDGSVRHA